MSSSTVEATVVILVGPRQLELRTERLDSAALGPTGVLCKTLVSVISPGTELAAYTGQAPLRDGPAYPRLQGYCNVARVLAVGADVGSIVPGDRVLSFASHRSHFVTDAGDLLAKVPEGVLSEQAACAYLYHLGYNAVLRADVRAGSRVLVIGLGVLGLTSVAMAALAGAQVVALSDHPHPQQLATQFGARRVFARAESPALSSAWHGELADVVISTSNSWSDWKLALEMAGQRATIAVLGFPGRSESAGGFNPLDSRTFYAKQLRIEAVGHSPERADSRGFSRFNERANLGYLVDRIALGQLQPSLLISGRYPGARIERAYQDLLARKHSPVTYALQWNPE
jgi:threonine dehydrogenase-like Zn-dependent dehydrogenase